MKKGTFVNYQMAEAISEYRQGLLTEDRLEELKKRWFEQDTIVGYDVKIGKRQTGMEDITIEKVKQLSESIKEYDTYSCECAGNMQYCLKRSEDGSITFDFSYLEKILELAKMDNKKIVVDSAIVFGDHFPENMKSMSKEETEMAIKEYMKELTSRFGDQIERVDVLSSIIERRDPETMDSAKEKFAEDFWKERFGENYGEEVLKICRETIGDRDIKLGWSEFYITNPDHKYKLDKLVDIIGRTPNLDTVCLQDGFRADKSNEYILQALKQIEASCKENGKKLSITELGCKVVGEDLEKLKRAFSNGEDSKEYRECKKELESRIGKTIESVVDFAENSDIVDSVEGRISNDYDYVSKDFPKGMKINTLGKREEREITANGFFDFLQSQTATTEEASRYYSQEDSGKMKSKEAEEKTK